MHAFHKKIVRVTIMASTTSQAKGSKRTATYGDDLHLFDLLKLGFVKLRDVFSVSDFSYFIKCPFIPHAYHIIYS